jgi:hypothetical protein
VFEKRLKGNLELLKLIGLSKGPGRSIHHNPLISQYPFDQCEDDRRRDQEVVAVRIVYGQREAVVQQTESERGLMELDNDCRVLPNG